MSAHDTKIFPHDHENCHTSRTWPKSSGDCGTRFEVYCSCGWMQGAESRAHADALAIGHRGYSPDAPVVVWHRDADITDDQLRALFARHCECRPLDLTRGADDHAAIHDCDKAILRDVQVALGVVKVNEEDHVVSSGRTFQAVLEARARCAEIWKQETSK